jgi:hypothetical protein
VLHDAVMKKTALRLTLILGLLFLVAGVFFVNLVKGNAVWPIGSIHIEAKPVYYSSTINLSYNAVFPSDFGISALGRKWIVYSLDGAENVTVYDEYDDLKFYNGSFTLSGLSSGLHHIDIHSKNGTFMWGTPSLSGWCDAEDTASFTIDLSGKSPTPKPTLAPASTPAATPEPTKTPYREANVQNTSQYLAVGGMIVVTVAVVCVGLGLLFYFIRRKQSIRKL